MNFYYTNLKKVWHLNPISTSSSLKAGLLRPHIWDKKKPYGYWLSIFFSFLPIYIKILIAIECSPDDMIVESYQKVGNETGALSVIFKFNESKSEYTFSNIVSCKVS